METQGRQDEKNILLDARQTSLPCMSQPHVQESHQNVSLDDRATSHSLLGQRGTLISLQYGSLAKQRLCLCDFKVQLETNSPECIKKDKDRKVRRGLAWLGWVQGSPLGEGDFQAKRGRRQHSKPRIKSRNPSRQKPVFLCQHQYLPSNLSGFP